MPFEVDPSEHGDGEGGEGGMTGGMMGCKERKLEGKKKTQAEALKKAMDDLKNQAMEWEKEF